MLCKLTIKNYALIDKMALEFNQGFSVITGETGSGKSILLGALGLVLGNRADAQVLHKSNEKCVVEGDFDISGYNLKATFEDSDLDYAERSFFRREILSSGRSRAFINDTPVSLSLMKSIGSQLVDIHSQHDVVMLKNNNIQLNALDAFAKNEKIKRKYIFCFDQWNQLRNEYDQLKESIEKSNMDKDYIEFQLKELHESDLKQGEKEKLEKDQKIAENAESIKGTLSEVNEIISSDQNGLISNIRLTENLLSKIAGTSDDYQELFDRTKSVRLEMTDLQQSIEQEELSVEIDPSQLIKIQERLDLLYRLESKHRVENTSELIDIQEKLSESLFESDRLAKQLFAIEKEKAEFNKKLKELADELSESRRKKSTSFEKKIKELLGALSMNKAEVKVQINKLDTYNKSGQDQVSFLFSANKGAKLQDLSKVASGGELSRVMLAIKSILADRSGLPVLIFDEIDTGISGKVSSKVAKMMLKISDARQVFAITHQAQVASLGQWHYKVSKHEEKNRTLTQVRTLDKKERVKEIAEMLSGNSITENAMANATELLEQDV